MIRERVNAGSLCSPSYDKNNFSRRLKFALSKMDMEDARRYASKAFRSGESKELLQHGSTIAAIKSSCAWIVSGYGSYIDLEFDEAQEISKILTTQLSDVSPTEEDSDKPTRKRGG